MRMKKYNFFFLCYIVTSILFSQNTFNKHYHFDQPLAIANSIYVTDSCYYFSGLIVDSVPPYQEGLLFGKLDLDGNIITSNSILNGDYSYENWFTPLVYSNDGTFISMGFGYDSIDRYNYWMELTSEGVLLESKYFRNTYYPLEDATRVNDFIQHPISSSFFAVSQSFIEENELGITPGYNTTLTKLNSSGDSVFSVDYEYSFNLQPRSQILSNNEIIIGCSLSNHNLTSFNKKYFTKIIAVDTLGEIQWSWQSPSSLQQGANDMLATEDGGLVVVSGRGFLDQVNIETKRILWDRGLFFKLDSNRQVVWETEFQVPYYGRSNGFFHLAETIDQSGYIAAGKIVELYEPPGGTILGWLAKVSPEGDSLWSRKLFYYEYPDSLEYEHKIHDLQTTPDGGYLMSGETLDRNQLSTPIQQAWFIKVDAEGCLIPGCGLVDVLEPSIDEGPPLLLYPNPASDYLNVYLGDSGGGHWSFVVYNYVGQEMGRYVAASAHTTYMINVDHWPAGQYYLRVQDKEGRLLKAYPWVKL